MGSQDAENHRVSGGVPSRKGRDRVRWIETHGALRSSWECLVDWISPKPIGPGNWQVYGFLGCCRSYVRARTGQGRKHVVYKSRDGPDRKSGLEDAEDQAVGRAHKGWIRAANRTRSERNGVVWRIPEWQDRPI